MEAIDASSLSPPPPQVHKYNSSCFQNSNHQQRPNAERLKKVVDLLPSSLSGGNNNNNNNKLLADRRIDTAVIGGNVSVDDADRSADGTDQCVAGAAAAAAAAASSSTTRSPAAANRRRTHHHQRNFSDSTLSALMTPSHEDSDIGQAGKLSVDNLRCERLMEDSWQKVQQRLIDARVHDRELSGDIERENMHLYLSEILITAMEQVKWKRERDAILSAVAQHSNPMSCSESANSSSSDHCTNSAEQKEANEREIAADEKEKEESLDVLRSPEFGEYHTGASTFYTSLSEYDTAAAANSSNQSQRNGNDNSNECDVDSGEESGCEESAEAIASSLLRHFSNIERQKKTDDIEWLVSYADAPQMLLPMPTTTGTVCADPELDNEGKPIRLRGSLNWAPPRKQWIFNIHPPIRSVSHQMEQQNNRCAGCGIQVNRLYSRRMRYCDYYGKLFCQRCHQGTKMRIPARIIHQWSFREYPVSDIAERFLLDNYSQPVINASAVDSHFYLRVRRLRQMRILRTKLVHLWPFIRLCPLTDRTVTKYGNLRTMYTSIPKHLLCDVDVYSMADLENTRNGDLVRLIEPLVRYGQYHVESCERCCARAFVCELCDQHNELLFPFQMDKVHRCDQCGSLSHIHCAAERFKSQTPCPKCVRIAINSERHRHHSASSLSPTKSEPDDTNSSSV